MVVAVSLPKPSGFHNPVALPEELRELFCAEVYPFFRYNAPLEGDATKIIPLNQRSIVVKRARYLIAIAPFFSAEFRLLAKQEKPLSFAAQVKLVAIVEKSIETRCFTELTDKEFLELFLFAVENGDLEILQAIFCNRRRLAKIPLEKIEACFEKAAAEGWSLVIKAILENIAVENCISNEGFKNAFWKAAIQGHFDILRVFCRLLMYFALDDTSLAFIFECVAKSDECVDLAETLSQCASFSKIPAFRLLESWDLAVQAKRYGIVNTMVKSSFYGQMPEDRLNSLLVQSVVDGKQDIVLHIIHSSRIQHILEDHLSIALDRAIEMDLAPVVESIVCCDRFNEIKEVKVKSIERYLVSKRLDRAKQILKESSHYKRLDQESSGMPTFATLSLYSSSPVESKCCVIQ